MAWSKYKTANEKERERDRKEEKNEIEYEKELNTVLSAIVSFCWKRKHDDFQM